MRDEIWHVSSAVITVLPGRIAGVAAQIAQMPDIEIHARDERRIIITIEGRSSGELGEKLTRINLIEGVLVASMVFEHAEKAE